MKKLEISDTLSLPADAATQTFAFIARKGAGKTYAAGKLAELLIEQQAQVVILDTVGNWYGLRIAADGKGKGIDIPVFGGLRGDLPLQATAGHLVADVAVDTGRSLVIDCSQFSMSDRKRFATAFGEQLWKRKKGEQHPTPLMLIIEESQLIIPQFVGRDETHMVGIYEEIIRLGRNYGIGCCMISQRPQSVNKEVLNQTECLFVLQVNGAQERKSLKDWIVHQGMDTKILDELPSLPRGTAYVWSPQWLGILKKVEIAKKITFDASATPTVGDKTVRRNPAPLDLKEIETQMAATIEQAKANDPSELRKQLAAAVKRGNEMEMKLGLASKSAAKTTIKTETKEAYVLQDTQLHHLKLVLRNYLSAAEAVRAAEPIIKSIQSNLEKFTVQTGRNKNHWTAITSPPLRTAVVPRSNELVVPAKNRTVTPLSNHALDSSGYGVTNDKLPHGEEEVLTACLQFEAGLKRERITVLTGFKRSTRDAYIYRLTQKQLVVQRGEVVVATEAGKHALPHFKPLPVGDELQDHWRKTLPAGECQLFEHIIAAYPESISRERLSELTGFKRSTRDAYLYRMSSKMLFSENTSGSVRASENLF